jgi:hypothetical protein
MIDAPACSTSAREALPMQLAHASGELATEISVERGGGSGFNPDASTIFPNWSSTEGIRRSTLSAPEAAPSLRTFETTNSRQPSFGRFTADPNSPLCRHHTRQRRRSRRQLEAERDANSKQRTTQADFSSASSSVRTSIGINTRTTMETGPTTKSAAICQQRTVAALWIRQEFFL